MSDNKKYFEEFLQIWPKGAFAKPVMGERGQKNLPSGAEGGENLDLEIHYGRSGVQVQVLPIQPEIRGPSVVHSAFPGNSNS